MTNKIQCKNMNKYDFESGFAGECLVEMNDGQLKRLRKEIEYKLSLVWQKCYVFLSYTVRKVRRI